MKRELRFGERVKVGVMGALLLAGLFSLLAGLARFDLGGDGYHREFRISYARTVALYFGSLPVGGAVVGAMGRLFRYALGAFCLGFLMALFPFLTAAFLINLPGLSRSDACVVAISASLVIGGGGTLLGWSRTRHSGDSSRSD